MKALVCYYCGKPITAGQWYTRQAGGPIHTANDRIETRSCDLGYPHRVTVEANCQTREVREALDARPVDLTAPPIRIGR